MATEIEPRLNVIEVELQKLLSGLKSSASSAGNIIEGELGTIRTPMSNVGRLNPALLAATLLGHSTEAGANSDIPNPPLPYSGGKIKQRPVASEAQVQQALIPSIEQILSRGYTPIPRDSLDPFQEGATLVDPRVTRVNEGARLRGSNTVATQDANGNITISGGAGFSPATPSVQSQQQVTPEQGFVSLLNSYSQATAPTAEKPLGIWERQKALDQLQGEYGAAMASMKNTSMTQAEAEYGLPQLRQSLKDSIARDMSETKNYARFGISGITKKIMAELTGAESAAREASNRIDLENPAVQNLKKMGDSFITTERKKLEFQFKQEELQNQINQDLQANYPGAVSTAKAAFPELRKASPEDQVKAGAKLAQTAEGKIAIQNENNPSAIMELAASGNGVAASKAAYEQTKQLLPVGTPDDSIKFQTQETIARNDIGFIRDMATNQAKYEKQFIAANDLKKIGKLDVDAVETELNKLRELEKSSGSKAAAMKQRSEWAQDFLLNSNKDKFFASPSSWSNAEEFHNTGTAIGKLYSLASATTPNPTVSDLSASLSKMDNASERATAFAQLQTMAQAAAEKASGSYYGGFANSLDLKKEINMKASETMLDRIKNALWNTQTGLGAQASLGVLSTVSNALK